MTSIDPHKASPVYFSAIISALINNRQLIFQMIKRNIVMRYKGSVIGMLWAFLNPLLMISIYTFVFSIVFKARWGDGETNNINVALLIFVGIIVHSFFSEVINASPSLIISNSNYVKKVIFPLEILSIVNLGAAFFQVCIGTVIFLIAFMFSNGYLCWTIIFSPLIFLPLVFFVLGTSWILASLGVYVRDISQITGIFCGFLLFMSPVFYPLNMIPQKFHFWILLNPLTFIIEQLRKVVIFGGHPDWTGLFIYTLISISLMWVGFFWFQKTRRGFADVL